MKTYDDKEEDQKEKKDENLKNSNEKEKEQKKKHNINKDCNSNKKNDINEKGIENNIKNNINYEQNNKDKKNNEKSISLKIVIIVLFYLYDKNKSLRNNNLLLMSFNKYFLYENSNINLYFNITNFNYIFSLKYGILKAEYNIGFYDINNNNLIIPTNLILYNDIRIFCHIKKNNLEIFSIANIYRNKYFKCMEFFNLNDEIKLGLKIAYNNNEKMEFYTCFFLTEKLLYFNYLEFLKNYPFSTIYINKKYSEMIKKFDNKIINETLKLKKSFWKYPYCTLKIYTVISENRWVFTNIYNYHFCFCKGEKCFNIINYNHYINCKFSFYLYIIDNNRDVYKKTNYLFMDFIYANLSSDDTYPVFKKMFRQGYSAHYITEKDDIYKEFCGKGKKCLTILSVEEKKILLMVIF